MAVAGTLTYKTELDTSGIKKSGSVVKGIIAGLGITKLISTAMNTIKSSTDDAIKRLDTLNNFPKVMSNLGISADKSSKSIQKMSDKLAGLPTTLDQGASAVQRFTSKNNDVEKSTDIFLALNNAILAGGAPTEMQATALEQLSQAYAKGKPDMMEWRSAMSVMPAQLNQIAQAMGFGANGADELGEALRNGDVTMDDFMNTIVELNEKGVDGFENFETQARNSTGGIATSITVAKTQIVKGVTDLIQGINDGLAKANLPSISEIISTIGKKAKEVLDALAEKLPAIIDFLKNLFITIQPFLPIIEGLAFAILSIVTAYLAYQKVVKIVTAVQTALNIVMNMNPIGLIVMAIAGLIAILVILYKKSESFRKLANSVFKEIKDAFMTLWEYLKPVLEQIIESVKKIWEQIKPTIQQLMKAVGELMKALEPIIKIILDLAIKRLQWIISLISFLVPIIAKIVTVIIQVLTPIVTFIINVITSIINFFTITIPNAINSFIEFIKNLPQTIISFFQNLPENIGYIIGLIIGKIISFGIRLLQFVTTDIPNFINGIVTWFAQLPGKIWQWLSQLPGKIATAISNMANTAKQKIPQVINAIVNTFKKLPDKMFNIGKDIVKGLWKGIKNVKQWLLDKIKDFAKGFTKGLKKALGIKSPSKVMADEVGQWIPKGIAVGIDMNSDSIKDAMNNMYKEMNQAIKVENGKMNFDVVSGNVYNKSFYQTPIAIDLNASVEMDRQKVGRLVTPEVTRTIKSGGGI